MNRPTLPRALFGLGLAVLSVALIFALEDRLLLAAAIACLGALFLWAAYGFDLPGTAGAYYRPLSRRLRDWRLQVEWSYDPPADRRNKAMERVRRMKPPDELREQHQRLVDLMETTERERVDRTGNAAREVGLQRERRRVLVATAREAREVRERLVGDAAATHPQYTAELREVGDRSQRQAEQTYQRAEQATEDLIGALGRMQAPEPLKQEHSALQHSLDRYLSAIRDLHDAYRHLDSDAVDTVHQQLEAVESELDIVMEALHASWRREYGLPS